MRLVGMALLGGVALLVTCASLFVVQNANADSACESYPASVPGADFSDVRGVDFKNSFLNLGGRCTYRMEDGSTVTTREPGWWFSGTLIAIAAVFALLAVYVVRRKGYSGWLFGLFTLVSPLMGLLLALIVRRRTDRAASAL